jgi:hypothetical protein
VNARGEVIDLDQERHRRRGIDLVQERHRQGDGEELHQGDGEELHRHGMANWPPSCIATWLHFESLGLNSEITWHVLDEIAHPGRAS